MKNHLVEETGLHTPPEPPGPDTDYVVGIDTGGTFTDGVLLDYRSRSVIAADKTLTTRENLTHGIVEILQRLRIPDPSKVKLVGISSTLATNSIAEGKARQVGLVLIGYDTDLITSYRLESKFPTKYLGYFKGGHTPQGTEKDPLDLTAICTWVNKQLPYIDALAISSFFSPLNPEHEERVLAAIRETCSLPVVMGHQLSTKLDSIRRATTACLNASLVAVMQEFIEAVKASLHQQGLDAPLMIVKGDGSLMPYAQAAQKPVETVLSGPAASAIGGRFLSALDTALVIDVGGTTTDLALIENSQVSISEDGALVGDIETAVKAARIRTVGMGCDSRIAFGANGKVQVGPDRVVPLSRLAARFPEVAREILNLKHKRRANWRLSDIEYWLLYKPGHAIGLDPKDPRQRILDLLGRGPCSLTRILETMQVHHPVQLNMQSLIRQGYIEHATLTPTDLLHVNGQMDAWDVPAAHQALEYACTLLEKDPTRFVDETLDGIVAAMAKEAVVFLARQKPAGHLPDNPDGIWGPWLMDESLADTHPFLAVSIASRVPLIGIGAPADIFVRRVAHALNAPFVLPPHAPVANAVGAVAGSVMVEKEALIYAQEVDEVRTFVVQMADAGTGRRFEEAEPAREHARETVARIAHESALAAGAADPQVVVQNRIEGALVRVMARAVGNPRLSEQRCLS